MAIDQVVLARMIAGSADDLTTLTSSLASINANIILWTEDDTLYKAIRDKDRTDLEARLAIKLTTLPNTIDAWQATHTYLAEESVRPVTANTFVYSTSAGGTSGGAEPVWPIIVGDTVVDSGGVEWECGSLAITYDTSKGYGINNISAWQIRNQTIDIAVYQYQNTVADAKTYGGLTDFADGNKTYRNVVSGFSQSLNWVRIGIQGHSTYVTTITNLSIGERLLGTANVAVTTTNTSLTDTRLAMPIDVYIGSVITCNGKTMTVTANDATSFTCASWSGGGNPGNGFAWSTFSIVDGTMEFFQFSGSNRVNINSGVIGYTDWLEYDVDSAKTYFITMFVESLYGTKGAGSYYSRNGDYSLEENWASGTLVAETRSIQVIQGWLNGATPGYWDGDSVIIQSIEDWAIMYPLIYSSPFGTVSMLSSLNAGLSIITSRWHQIDDRNPILGHYVIP
jgi:hypothetical protein